MVKKLISFVFVLIFLVPFVFAQPPQTQVNLEGLDIAYPKYQYVSKDVGFTLHTHVFNSSSLVTNETASCFVHIYDHFGNHSAKVDMDWEYPEFEAYINAGNFSENGFHSYIISCNSSTQAGFSSGAFEVNLYGQELTEGNAINFNFAMVFMMVLFVLALIGIFAFQNPSGKLACYFTAHVLFIVGTFSVWQFNEGYAIPYTALGGIYEVMFYVSIIALFPMVLLSIAWMVYIHTMNEDVKRLMDRGFSEEEALDRAKRRRR